MNNKPLFTVVIPVYKVEAYLDRCMRSVCCQTYPDVEIILVDDGSTDRCPQMCDGYADQDPRVRVIHKINGGLSSARNAGIEAAQGDYILFLDSDDYIDLDTCSRFLPYTEKKCDILCGNGIPENGTARLIHKIENDQLVCSGPQYLKEALNAGSMPMAAWLYVYRKDFLRENNLLFKQGILHEDEEFTPRAFLQASKVANTNISFYHYIVRDDSITTSKDMRKNMRDLYTTCQQLLLIYQGIPDRDLQNLLRDSLVVKYLSLFQQGNLVRYGKEFVHKRFVLNNACSGKTRAKALLFSLSPRIYARIHQHYRKYKIMKIA